jgi:hypothetical protein
MFTQNCKWEKTLATMKIMNSISLKIRNTAMLNPFVPITKAGSTTSEKSDNNIPWASQNNLSFKCR